jgi:hypothetical protein
VRFLNPTQTRNPWHEIPESNSNAGSSLTWDSSIQLKRGIVLDVRFLNPTQTRYRPWREIPESNSNAESLTCVSEVCGGPMGLLNHFFFFRWALGKSFHPTFGSFTFLEQISRKFGKPRTYLPTYLFDMITYFCGALWWPWRTSTYTATFTFLSERLLVVILNPRNPYIWD